MCVDKSWSAGVRHDNENIHSRFLDIQKFLGCIRGKKERKKVGIEILSGMEKGLNYSCFNEETTQNTKRRKSTMITLIVISDYLQLN